ncbi:MAG: hypothetical protein D6680_15750 [Cyanobacteria bacterium J007]|nr:MAG: hypothetical protein D6680_15750 [Cyanobacteria bacterium J007]
MIQTRTRQETLKPENLKQENLKVIARLLQERLHLELPQRLPVRIQCALHYGQLLVLAEHRPGVRAQVGETFEALTQAIAALIPDLAEDLKLYLRVAGHERPYAFEALRSTSGKPAAETTPDEDTSLHSPGEDPLADRSDESEDEESAIALAVSAFPPNPFDELALDPQDAEQIAVRPQQKRARKPAPPWLVPLSASIVTALVAGGSAFYALSRPCAIGRCELIDRAEQLSQGSAAELQAVEYKHQLLDIHEKLDKATTMLERIPSWSGASDRAATLIRSNRVQLDGITEVVAALDRGLATAESAKNPPHSVEIWQEVAAGWDEAIAQLEAVSPDSPVYPFAREKLQEYRQNRTAIDRRIDNERQAQAQLQSAQSAGQVIKARQGVAQTTESWERIIASWDEAIAQLERIPDGTTAVRQARQLIAAYQTEATRARDRLYEEQLAQNAYDRAVLEVDRAEGFQQQNQWTLAVEAWTNASTYLEQIPLGTYPYAKAAKLGKTVKPALAEAREILDRAIARQDADAALKKTCSGSVEVCAYSVSDRVLRVQLQPDYLSEVRKTATTADRTGNPKVRADLTEHVQTLQNALETISDNTQIPLELYDPYGALLGRHTPR